MKTLRLQSTFEKKLTAMFAIVEPEFRDATVKKYVTSAESQLDSWISTLKGPEPPYNPYFWAGNPPHYVRCKSGAYSRAWADKQKQEWFADVEGAKRDAIDSVRRAREHFIQKQSKKLATAIQRYDGIPKLDGNLVFNGLVVTGHLTVKYGSGSSFRIDMDMIVNHRFNTGNSFYQFPARFKDAVLYGVKMEGRLSEAFMAQNFKSRA